MKKFLTLAVLLSGLSLGFAKNAKQVKTESSNQSTEKINSIVVDGNEKSIITKIDSKGFVHVFYYYTTVDPETGGVIMNVVDVDIWYP